MGLNRAFIYAGTPSVLASLWSVEDAATRDLMVAFYEYLKDGYAKDEALRQAQMKMMGAARTAHPYYWAGFVLTGDGGQAPEVISTEMVEQTRENEPTRGSESEEKNEGSNGVEFHWLVVGVLLIVVVAGGMWAWKRQR